VDNVQKPELRAQEVTSKKKTPKSHGTRRGYFKPSNPDKYEGDVENIVYRSGIELRLMKYLDSHPSILKWSSEETIIPYICPLTKSKTGGPKYRRYFVDFKTKIKTKSGQEKTYLIECKWSTATVPPKVPKKKTRRYYAEQAAWLKNQKKWEAAKALCEKKGWEWLILTEKQLSY
jgi:hypothetical protein